MLTTYQRNHLLPTYRKHGDRLYPGMVEASRAHVVMLGEAKALPAERVRQLLTGLEAMRGEADLPEYDGMFEDTYFAVEKNLAAELGIVTGELDLQLARSRNDLDAGVFRMILREELAAIVEALLGAADALLQAAERTSETTIVAYTHRRPAQPISMGHILAGYADALLGQGRMLLGVLGQMNQCPLGASVIAGTDVPISSERLAELLGFDGVIPNAYSSVAGADHFMANAAATGQMLATAARLARVLQEWMSNRWIETPGEFCQGSSAMPQKRNPVVLEHMQSMAVAAVADTQGVLGSVAASWWEDSNTATTDIQATLWTSNDRALRFLTMLGRLFEVLQPLTPPSGDEVVEQGTTTTAAAEALALRGVPFRSAHHLLGSLVREYPPASWNADVVQELAQRLGLQLDADDVEHLMRALKDPTSVLDRAQPEGPGREALAGQIRHYRGEFGALREQLSDHFANQERARKKLDDAVHSLID